MRNPATLTVLFLTFASGCTTVSYVGDGRFTDNGLIGYHYGLDLGPVDLTQRSAYSYRLIALPGREWAIGFQITEVAPNPLFGPAPSHPAKVRMTLQSPDGEVIFVREARVHSWIWNHGDGDRRSFYYTRFAQRPNAAYFLSLEVLEPDPQSCCGASLVASGM